MKRREDTEHDRKAKIYENIAVKYIDLEYDKVWKGHEMGRKDEEKKS